MFRELRIELPCTLFTFAPVVIVILFLGEQDRVPREPCPRPHRRLSLPRPPLPTGLYRGRICP